MKKKILSIVLALVMILALVPMAALAGNNQVTGPQTIYLKGSGSTFKESWNNTFIMDPDNAEWDETLSPTVWHLVYTGDLVDKKTGKDTGEVTEMQLTFTNGYEFKWNPGMGYSTNGGGNNAGWVILAPAGWEIAYVDKGNGNESDSFLKTNNTKNVNFNISGYTKGSKIYCEIVKIWLDVDGNVIPKPADVEAYFNIYDEDGDLVCGPVKAGKYNVKPGTYTIEELDKDGFTATNTEWTVVVAPGSVGTFTCYNQENVEKYGTFSMAKTVDDTIFTEWAYDGDVDVAELISGIFFEIYKAEKNADGTFTYGGDAVGTGSLDFNGTITLDFPDGITGWYAVVEVLEPNSLAAEVFDAVDPMYLYFRDDGKITSPEFDYDAFYIIDNGYSDRKVGTGTLNYPGLNNNGDLFYIGVINDDPNSDQYGKEYASFCANSGSSNFAGEGGVGCSGYYQGEAFDKYDEEMDLDAFLSALNFIEDMLGNLNDYRAVTQTVIWALLGAIDVDNPLFESTTLQDWEKTAVRAALEAADEGYTGKGVVVDLVFMVCDKHNAEENAHDYSKCQPQLVPVYLTFDNKTGGGFFSTVSFNKVKYGGLLEVDADEFGFDLFQIVDGKEEYIDTFYTDFYGAVTVDILADGTCLQPGNYVFRELWTTVFPGGLGFDDEGNPVENYNLVWKPIYPNGADGLYFEITAKGDVIWAEGCDLDEESGNAILNNEIYGKHTVLWAPDGYDPVALTLPHFQVIELGEGLGKIIYLTNEGLTMEVVSITMPSCERRGIVWLGCSDGTGTSVEFGELCDHDYVYIAIVADGEHDGWVWYGGQNGCVCSGMEYNLEAWFALGGYDF